MSDKVRDPDNAPEPQDPWALGSEPSKPEQGWEGLGEHLLDAERDLAPEPEAEPEAEPETEPETGPEPVPEAEPEPVAEGPRDPASAAAPERAPEPEPEPEPEAPREDAAAGELVGDAAGVPVTFSSQQVARVRELLTRLHAARRSSRFYPPQHPAVAETLSMLFDVIARYHAEGVDVPLAFFEGEVFLGERFLPEDSVMFDQLVRDMASIGAGSIAFRRGLTADELVRALPVLAAEAAQVKSAGGIDVLAAAADIPHVEIGAVTVVDAVLRPEQVADKELAKEAYSGALELMRELERVIRTNRALSATSVKGVVRSLVDNVLNNRYAMLELSGLKDYDEYTFFHSVNVSILSLALGSMITNDYRFLSSLGVGALMHDIGKMAVDLQILNKPGALTSDEWATVRLHPVYGAQVATAMPGLDKSSVVVILEHHMRQDSTGYPPRVPPRRQHLASRIVAVADAYDAMTSRRSYSAARLQDEAMSLLVKNAGSAFDETLVRLFITMLGVYPPRSVVKLSSGQVAIVLAPSDSDMLRPLVRVVADEAGGMVEPFDIDLSDPRAAQGRGIVRCLDPEGMNVEIEDFL